MTTPVPISGLTEAAALDGTELVEAVQAAASVKATVQNIANLADPDVSGVAINSQAASYTLVLADAGKVVRVTAEATITVPPESSVDWSTVGGGNPIVNVRAATASAVTIAAGTGVTINTPETLVLDGQWAEVSLHYVGSDVWDLVGAVEVSA